MKTKTWFVVPLFQSKMKLGEHTATLPDGMKFLPAFDSFDQAQEYYPGRTCWEIEETLEENNEN